MHHLTNVPRKLSVDAVTASVDLPLERLVSVLNRALATTEIPGRVPGRGYGYQHAVALVNPNTLAHRALVMHGSAHSKPCALAEGTEKAAAPDLYQALVDHCHGLWLPSRLDVALDFDHDQAFDILAGDLIAIATRRGLALDQRGDWTRGTARTLYVGSRQSPFYLRLYEYRAKHGYGFPCRLELEIKVKPKHRAAIAAKSPWELLHLAPVVHELLVAIGLDMETHPLSPGQRPPQSVERDTAFLANTAWPALTRLIAHHHGDPLAAIAAIADHRTETERTRELLRERDHCINEQLHKVEHL
jgi:hypothetical protein